MRFHFLKRFRVGLGRLLFAEGRGVWDRVGKVDKMGRVGSFPCLLLGLDLGLNPSFFDVSLR